MKRLAFEALIKQIISKSLVSGDKATRVIIEFDSSNQTEALNLLNELHHADKTIMVGIWETQEK
jgi:hypothetical protein